MPLSKLEVEIYGEVVNAVVLRLPTRKHPGVLVQGDSLHILLGLVRGAGKALAEGNTPEAGELIEEVREILEGYEEGYRSALAAAG
jgi:hypothetical protein